MDAYYHGVRVMEEETALVTPIEGTAALQVIFGTAPVNLAQDPYGAVNVPKICYSFSDCRKNFGYSEDFAKYSLCMSMDTNFRVFAVAPIILVNVLDPKKHVKNNEEKQYTVVGQQVLVDVEGILLDTLEVRKEDEILTKEIDYIASFNDAGMVIVTLLAGGKGDGLNAVKVTSKSIDANMVTEEDIIGGYDADTGKESGIETIRQIYPRVGMTAGLLLAPGWSHHPMVGAILAAKCEGINGVFRCECILDLDTQKAKRFTDCKQVKEDSGFGDKHSVVLWPKVQRNDKIYAYSAIYGAMVAYTDASNDDVPNLSPSNKLIRITGTLLEDGTEVVLDQDQANMLNGQGIVTAINDSGWKAWGNNTACYPSNTDPKDRWICCRRFFTWWGNSFILTYKKKVDDPMNKTLIESICDTENIRGNSYTSQGKCAGASIEYRAEENSSTELLNGRIVFRQHLAPYTPAEDITNILSFDTDMLSEALK